MERFATDFNVVKHSNLEYPLDYFSLTKNPARHLPDGTLLFDACLNDVLYIAPTVKDTDDADRPFVVINQIINDEIIDRKKAHSHGSHGSHSTVVCPSGKRSRERMDLRIRFTCPSAFWGASFSKAI